ncbi:hypothetical protein WJX72_001543 [[Myrmecia] bisecta]|uniref:NADH-ubiquinone oxidoreductase 21kDa subunit N-terminal domain-containing protein n=1 Tax=[Myrmecia] bisecta TaxID=41462 RepID=A0AAW1Q751_9CHLO
MIFDEPKYPVIDSAPGFWKTVGNFSLRDYALVAATTGVSLPFGYVTGRSAKMAVPSMYMAGAIGALAGVMLSYQNSSGRLMGFVPNDREVEAGLAKER